MTPALRVGVNLLWLAPGRVGGSEEYLTRQLAGLPDDADIEPVLYCQPGFADAHRRLTSRFETVPMPVDRDWRGLRLVAEHSWLAARTRSHDLVHHGGGTVPLVGKRPIVLTVHDVQYLDHPEHFSSARRAYLRSMMPRSVRRASIVTTPSEYVRGSLIDAFGIDERNVAVVPHGVPDIITPSGDAVEAVRRRFDLADRPFVVYPAITHPHKGHHVLVEMLAHTDPDLLLVLTGGEGVAEKSVMSAVSSAGVADRVRRTGRVGDADRDGLIAGAEALVFPSEYEGFGAPLVESMALETPVVCGSHPAIREVAGGAAVVVESGDPSDAGAAWATAVAEARSRRHELVAAGTARRSLFTLEVSGRALADAYGRAAS